MIDPVKEHKDMQMQARLQEAIQFFKAHLENMEKEGKLPAIELPAGMGGLVKMMGIDLSYKGMIEMFEAEATKMFENPDSARQLMTMLYDVAGYCLGYTDQIGG